MQEYGLHKLKLRFGPQHKDLLWAVQADSGRAYEVQVLDERGRDHDVSGLSLSFYVSDGADVGRVDAKILDAKRGLFLVEPPNELFKTPGTHRAQFALKGADGKLVQSRIFDIHIEASIANGATVGKNILVDFGRIDKAVELLEDYDQTLKEAKGVDASLDGHIEQGKVLDASLQASTVAAKDTKAALDQSIGKAQQIDSQLAGNTEAARSVGTQIAADTDAARAAGAALKADTATAKGTEESLKGTITAANASKDNLDKSKTAADGTEATISGMISSLETTKSEVQKIIAQGNLGQYATKAELSDGLNAKLDKQDGKQLSTNDYTNAEKDKLASLSNFTIVDDLTTGGTDKALSAEQGKVLFTYAGEGKAAIVSALTGKGQAASADESFKELAAKISGITSSSGYKVGDRIPKDDVKLVKKALPNAKKVWEFTGLADSYVRSLVADAQGHAYASDGKKIIKLSTDGNPVWEFTGNGDYIGSIAVDTQGIVYAKIGDNIRKISPKGQDIGVFAATTYMVEGMKLDAKGYLYTFGENGEITKITPYGIKEWETNCGTRFPDSFSVDAQGYAYTSSSSSLSKTAPDGKNVWGRGFNNAYVDAFTVDAQGVIYALVEGKITKISPEGQDIGEIKSDCGRVVALDAQGNIYTTSRLGTSYSNMVLKLAPDGRTIWTLNEGDSAADKIVVDPLGYIYVSGSKNKVIKIADFEEYYEVLK